MDFRECERDSCLLRFPISVAELKGTSCPRCGGSTHLVHTALVRPSVHDNTSLPRGHQIVAILDNIRSAFNVGSIIRTADGVGINQLYLCGITPSPEHSGVSKTALGAETNISISLHSNAMLVIQDLIEHDYFVVALEKVSTAQSLFDPKLSLPIKPIAIVVGSELAGIDPGILDICHLILDLPMLGVKNSINVAVAFGVAAYYLNFSPDIMGSKEIK